MNKERYFLWIIKENLKQLYLYYQLRIGNWILKRRLKKKGKGNGNRARL